jgi:hypothetical protein
MRCQKVVLLFIGFFIFFFSRFLFLMEQLVKKSFYTFLDLLFLFNYTRFRPNYRYLPVLIDAILPGQADGLRVDGIQKHATVLLNVLPVICPYIRVAPLQQNPLSPGLFRMRGALKTILSQLLPPSNE